jgi:hypothetical protein
MGRNRKQRRQSHGSAWRWEQTDCWYYSQEIVPMKTAAKKVRCKKSPPAWHDAFVAMVPAIETHAKIVFRRLDAAAPGLSRPGSHLQHLLCLRPAGRTEEN